MTTDPAAQSTPTPAPVAVPDRQAFRLRVRAHLLDRLVDEFPGIPFEERVALAESSANELLWAAQDYSERHAPREDAPRPEPVTDPLPSEAVERDDVIEHFARGLCLASNADPDDQFEHPYTPAWHDYVDQARALCRLLPAADQRARDEGTVREEIAQEIEAERIAGNGHANQTLNFAARIARGGTR